MMISFIIALALTQQDPWAPWAQWATKVEQRVSTLEKFQVDALKLANEAQAEADEEHEQIRTFVKSLDEASNAIRKRIDALESVTTTSSATNADTTFPWWIDMVKDGTLVTLLTGVAAGLYRMSGRLQRTEAAVGASTDTPKLIEVPPPTK